MDELARQNWTPAQIQAAINMYGQNVVQRDVITGELFVPQFEGQRTNVVLDVDLEGERDPNVIQEKVKEAIRGHKEAQWAGNQYYDVTANNFRELIQEEFLELKRRGEFPTDSLGNPMGYEEAAEYHYNQRFPDGVDILKEGELDRIVTQLVGGVPQQRNPETGRTEFLTEGGINKRYTDDDGNQIPLNIFLRTAEGLNAWAAKEGGELANFTTHLDEFGDPIEGARNYNVVPTNQGHQILMEQFGGAGENADAFVDASGQMQMLDTNGNPALNADGTQVTSDQTRNAVYDWINVQFPWARDLGLEEMIRDAIENNLDDDVMIAQIRQSPQYLAAFPGITDEQGRMRFLDEADYVDQVRQYRNVLRDAGSIGDRLIFDPNTESPLDYAAFMERGISTEELSQRLDTFRNLNNASSGVRAAFKAYANMDVPVEMLYQAVVDPKTATDLIGEYNQNVLDANYSYPEQLANWTDAIREQTLEQLTSLETQGVLPEGAMNRINALSGDEQQALVEALYIGDVTENDPLLEFDELAEAYQFAVIGGAASEQGLVAPSLERIRAIREAGINRAQALKAYGMYSGQKGLINAMLSRTNVQGQGMSAFTQSDFEEAVFLNQAEETDLLTRARQSEQALGRAGGGFATSMQGNRLRQTGRSGSGAAY
tara:strand:+ start:19394 stop:21367 length:1974 start_codon:yes stop_codon:yes gene_type:complete